MKKLSTSGNGGQEGGIPTPKPETLQEIEEVITRIISSLVGSKKAKNTSLKYQYVTGSRLSELFIENPDEFREILYMDYGQLSDEIIARIVEALAEIAQSEEKPPPMDSEEFKKYVAKLAEKLERRLESMSFDVMSKQRSAGKCGK